MLERLFVLDSIALDIVERCDGETRLAAIVVWYMECKGKINIDDPITHTMPLEEINSAFDLMHAGRSIRSGVVY